MEAGDEDIDSSSPPSVIILENCNIGHLSTENINRTTRQRVLENEATKFASSSLRPSQSAPHQSSAYNENIVGGASSAPVLPQSQAWYHNTEPHRRLSQSLRLPKPAIGNELVPVDQNRTAATPRYSESHWSRLRRVELSRPAIGKELVPVKRSRRAAVHEHQGPLLAITCSSEQESIECNPSNVDKTPDGIKEPGGERIVLERQKDDQKFELVSHTVGGVKAVRGSDDCTNASVQKPKTLKLHAEVTVDLTDRVCEGSKIFKGRHLGRDEDVAVKIITKYTEENKDEVDNLKLASKHENVVDYYFSGFCHYGSKKAIYIVMELCDTETLDNRIKNPSIVRTFSEKLAEILAIAQGLAHLHKTCHIFHRDLKPSNILYKDGVCKISDFGLSKRMPPGKSNTRRDLEKIGTDGWRAPETTDCEADSSYFSDIYSLGLIYYYDLTDGVHSHGPDKDRWQSRICWGRDRSLKMCESMPDGRIIEDLLDVMLSFSPSCRPDIESVLKHPTFWTIQKKLEFFGAIINYEEYSEEQIKQNKRTLRSDNRMASRNPCSLSEELDKRSGDLGEKVLQKNWFKALHLDDIECEKFRRGSVKPKPDCIMMKATGKKKKSQYDGGSVFSCVKFIRNRHEHHFQDRVLEDFAMNEGEFWEFFSGRYPYLFIYVYTVVKKCFKDKSADSHFKEIFERYF